MIPEGTELLVVGSAALAGLGAGIWWWRGRRATVATSPVPPSDGVASSGVRGALAKTAGALRDRLEGAFSREGASRYEAIEEALLGADVGVAATTRIVERVRARGSAADRPAIRQAVREEMVAALREGGPVTPTTRPWVILVTGVNGVGKTTTIGKLASRFARDGRKVLLVAGDTFRAAAADQLVVWGERAGVDVVRHAHGADPSAVVHDGLRAGVARAADVVLVDTAGRLHTRSPLMEELRKVHRTVAREVPGGPHETLLVVDATTGQNAVSQARTFGEAVELTGVIVTKLDGTAKGGTALAIAYERSLPVRYVGVGEGVDDLRPFDAQEFVDGLLGEG